jgi:arsenate reductase-like glutaredoxin family protein
VKLGKISVIGFGLVLLVVALFIYTQDSSKEEKTYNPPQMSQKQYDVLLKEVDAIQELLAKKGGFYEQVAEEMKKEGYNYSIAGIIYSKDDIRLNIIVPNNGVVTAQEQEQVNKIFKGAIIKNNLDPLAFKIEVTQGADDEELHE